MCARMRGQKNEGVESGDEVKPSRSSHLLRSGDLNAPFQGDLLRLTSGAVVNYGALVA